MTYHHVIAKISNETKFRCLFSDLSADDLNKLFVTPYEQGKSFLCGHDLISPNDLQSLQIVCTKRPEETERDEINRADRESIDRINSSSDC